MSRCNRLQLDATPNVNSPPMSNSLRQNCQLASLYLVFLSFVLKNRRAPVIVRKTTNFALSTQLLAIGVSMFSNLGGPVERPKAAMGSGAVSYTHLTLPTIYSV